MQAPSLAQPTFGSELRALWAIAAKEWAIFKRYPSWVISMLVWPVLFPIGYIFGAKALSGPDGASLATFARLTGTSDYISYIVLGTVLWMWLNMTLWDVGMYLRQEQMRGTLESNWLCPTWRVSMMLGGGLMKLAVSLAFMVVSLLEFRLVWGVNVLGGNIWPALVALLLTVPIVHGIGIAFASLVLRFKEANALVFLVRGIFMIFCGVSFPVAVLPGWMRAVADVLPLTYAIRAIRDSLLVNASFAQVWPDLRVLIVFAVVLPLVGYGVFGLTERRARRTGDLGQY